jgi:hypothetical protein
MQNLGHIVTVWAAMSDDTKLDRQSMQDFLGIHVHYLNENGLRLRRAVQMRYSNTYELAIDWDSGMHIVL